MTSLILFSVSDYPVPRIGIDRTSILFTVGGGFLMKVDDRDVLEGSLHIAWNRWRTYADLTRMPLAEGMLVSKWLSYLVFPGCTTDFVFEPERIIKRRWRLLYPINYCIAEFNAVFEEKYGRLVNFTYDLEVKREKKVEEFSGSFCFPIRKFAGELRYPLPGFTVLRYPNEKNNHPIDFRLARGVIIGLGSKFQTSIWADSPNQWCLTEQRFFNLNTYRLYFNQIPQGSTTRKGQKIQLSFELAPGGFVKTTTLDDKHWLGLLPHGFAILFENYKPLLIATLSARRQNFLLRLEDSASISSVGGDKSVKFNGVIGGASDYTAE